MYGAGYGLTARDTICQYPNPSYIIPPCINNQNHGRVSRTTCTRTSQSMMLIFQY
jgi:hypothetical protein